jgi:uncharacterized membrane protein
MSFNAVILALHLIAIAMGIGMTFSNLVNASLSLGNPAEFQKGLGLQRRMIGRIGDVVILSIWVTGGLALWLRGHQGLGTAFSFKMAFVILLTIAHIRGRTLGERMRREAHLNHVKDQRNLMLAGWALAVAALVCAVITFAT